MVAIIGGTVILIFLFLVLTQKSKSGALGASQVVVSGGQQYINGITALMGLNNPIQIAKG